MLFFPQDILFPARPGGGFSLFSFELLTTLSKISWAQAMLSQDQARHTCAWVPPSMPHPNTDATVTSRVIPMGGNTFPLRAELLPHTEAGLSYTEPKPKRAFYMIAQMGWGMRAVSGFFLKSTTMRVSSHAGDVVGESWPQPQLQGIQLHWYIWLSNAKLLIPQLVYLKLLLDF